MSSNSSLEINGKLSEFSLAELITEAAAGDLSGSFRLSSNEHKIAVYLEKGAVVYAASNLSGHRLPQVACNAGILKAEDLIEFRTAKNDIEFAQKLIESEKLMSTGLRELRLKQATEILRLAFSWFEGEWIFTPLVRVREDLHIDVNLPALLAESARLAPNNFVHQRFRLNAESFTMRSVFPADVEIQPHEAFLLSRFEGVLNFEELRTLSGLPDTILLRSIFVLWLGGFLHRYNWKGAFSEEKLAMIQTAKISPVARAAQETTESASGKAAEKSASEEAEQIAVPTESDEEKAKRELQEFLERVSKAKTHYQILGVDQKADAGEIKRVYFSLAKRFHPDKFHQAGRQLVSTLQEHFARVAQAYDTLKDQKSRELYDFKIRKMNEGAPTELTADNSFNLGQKALNDKNYAEAIKHFARAVQMDAKVASYHVSYALSLMSVPKYRHQAEAEFLEALKIEPNNADFRLYLAEFYLEQKLIKRAETEVRRVLTAQPNHKKAKEMLDSLTTNKSRV
jgi:curved DNA-binding protein CbpA